MSTPSRPRSARGAICPTGCIRAGPCRLKSAPNCCAPCARAGWLALGRRASTDLEFDRQRREVVRAVRQGLCAIVAEQGEGGADCLPVAVGADDPPQYAGLT